MGVAYNRFWHASLLVLLGVVELPVNAIVFRLFGIDEILTWLASLGMGCALIICAHALGERLQEHYKEEARRFIRATLILLPLLAISGIAYLSVQEIATDQPTRKVNMTATYIAMLSINAAVIGAAMALGIQKTSKQTH